MLLVISPAKKLDCKTKPNTSLYSYAELTDHSKILIDELRKCSIEDLTKLMNISYGLAETNLNRFFNWTLPFNLENAKQAILSFNGDVYDGINAKNFTDDDFQYAQKTLRIISGLYGVLKPLDLIQPYRLSMGTKLTTTRGKNLYAFWGNIITESLNKAISETGSKVVLNLASNEYFKSINKAELKANVIDIVFKENKNGTFRVVSFYAKKARGLMSQFIIKNKISNPEEIKTFNLDNYKFEKNQSTSHKMVFVR